MLYNQSKVVLNIHKFAKSALNIRTYEIYGAGQFQLIENSDSINSIFKNDELIMHYRSANDLVNQLRWKISEYKEQQIDSTNHTFDARLNQMFKKLNQNNILDNWQNNKSV